MSWYDDYFIIDAHAHIRPPDPVFKVGMSPVKLEKLMVTYSYDHCIIMSRNNASVEQAVKEYEGLLAHVYVNPKERGFEEVLRGYLGKEGFIGIKLNPLMDAYLPSSPLVDPVMEIAEEYDVPVQLHCGHPPFSLPWSFEPLAKRFPKVKMILLHMGHGHIVYINGAIEVAERNPNIYLETSGMPMHTKIKEAMERVGSKRVMYGDDLPCGHPSWELEKAKAAELDEKEFRKLLGGNAKNLYNID
jgi:hypothetical protein